MPQASHFTDGAAYERLMGRWTRSVGAIFLDWLAPPGGARWLEAGCGTGVFTELVVDRCSPADVIGVDPAAAQIEAARSKPIARDVEFRVADAQALPFESGAFDVVVSALVINFIPDRPRALAEMRRVVRPGGLVAGYVWDLAGEHSPNCLLRRGLSELGVKSQVSGTEDSRLEALSALFAGAGLEDVAARRIDVTLSYPDFDDFWRAHTPAYNPTGKAVAALSETDRDRLIEWLRTRLPASADGSITLSACANAVKARVPG